MRYSVLGSLLLLGTLPTAHANSDQAIVDGCAKIGTYAQQGAQHYQQQRYQKALSAFEDQASWLEFCQQHTKLTHKPISDAQIDTAYNNVGLSHAKLGQVRWARAWYELAPKSKSSPYNLQQLPPVAAQPNKQGLYVRYAGQGQWNQLSVVSAGQAYQIHFDGLRMGFMGMVSGPNVGEFDTTMAKNQQQAVYTTSEDSGTCTITMRFLPATSSGERVQVTQKGASVCGFGFGVYAEGEYLKVSDQAVHNATSE